MVSYTHKKFPDLNLLGKVVVVAVGGGDSMWIFHIPSSLHGFWERQADDSKVT